MNVLVLAPHPDDEAIGCGGTICLHVQRGDRVTVAFLTSGELGLKALAREQAWEIREREAAQAAGVLGLSAIEFLRQPDWYVGDHVATAARALALVVERERPHAIYVTHAQEWHPDHQASLPVVRQALEHCTIPAPTLLTYEVWSPLAAWYHVEDIRAVMRRKLQAIRCYESQIAQLRYDQAARGLALYRGAVAGGCRYAEVFNYADAAGDR